MMRFIIISTSLFVLWSSAIFAQSSVLTGDTGIGGIDLTFALDRKRECSHKLRCLGADKGTDSVNSEDDLSKKTIRLGTYRAKRKSFKFRRLPPHFSDVEGQLDGSTDGQLPVMFCELLSNCEGVDEIIKSNVLSMYYLCGRGETTATTKSRGKTLKQIFKALQKRINRKL